MNTIKFFLLAVLIISPSLIFSQKMADINADRVFNQSTVRVNLIVTDCYVNGKTIQAKITNFGNRQRVRYSYLWEVDGKPFGHAPQIECVTGEIVTVHVTQFPSGNQVSKTINISNGPVRQ